MANENIRNSNLLLILLVSFLTCGFGFCANLPISTVLNDGQGDFDPWNQARWADWYSDGKLIHTFDIDCSVKFASRSTAWEVDLSSLPGTQPSLFNISVNSGIDINGNDIIIDARKSHTKSWALWYYYYFSVNHSSDFGPWHGFLFHQTSSGTPGSYTELYNITLRGFRHAIVAHHFHQREVIVSNCTLWTNVWGVFPRGKNVTVTDCLLKENLLGGFYCEYNSNNWLIENNTFIDNNTRGTNSYGGIVLDACHNIVIRGNDFLPPSYRTRNYRTAISLYRNAGENGDIREYATSYNIIENNYFEGYNVAIDFSVREGMTTIHDQSFEGRCYSNNNIVRNNHFKNCVIGLNIRSHYNHIENNTFTNVEREIVLFCVFYKSLGNTIINQPSTTVWLWRTPSDYTSYADYVPYDNGMGKYISNSEKFFFIRSDGSATITNPDPAVLLVADHLLLPDPEDFNFDFIVDYEDLRIIAEYWLDPNCGSSPACLKADIHEDGQIDIKDFAKFAKKWKFPNDLQDYYSNGGKPVDIAVGNFAAYLPGDEIAVIWDEPVSNIDGSDYYTIIIYDANGVELDRCGRSERRWGNITAGNFLPDTGHILVNENYEIAATSSIPDENGKYPIYIFRKGWRDPAVTLLSDNVNPIAAIAAGNFNTTIDEYDEIAVVFEEGTTHIEYIKPSEPSWSATTISNSHIKGIASGNFDTITSNGDEIAAIERPHPSTKLIAAWDFEPTGGGILADKAPAGQIADNLSIIGNVNISEGKAVITKGIQGGLRAEDSVDLDLSESFTIWVRAKVLDDPERYLMLVDKRRFSDPEERSYAFFISHPARAEGGAVSGYFGIGGQISEDGFSGSNSIFNADGPEIVPLGQIRELVMRCNKKGDLHVEWYASTVENPTHPSHWQLVNGMTRDPNVRSIFNSSTDIHIGTTVDLTTPTSTIEFHEIRIYNDSLNLKELSDIQPSQAGNPPAVNYPIRYFRTSSSSSFATSASNSDKPWAAITGGKFDGGSTARSEIAAISTEPKNGIYEIEYYICSVQTPFKTVRHRVMDILPCTIDSGKTVVGESLSVYERCEGFVSSDYGSAVNSWGDFVTVLPSAYKQSNSIGVFFINSQPSNNNQKYLKLVPLLR